MNVKVFMNYVSKNNSEMKTPELNKYLNKTVYLTYIVPAKISETNDMRNERTGIITAIGTKKILFLVLDNKQDIEIPIPMDQITKIEKV